MRVAIVGAGLGGLSAACHLAGAGHQVTVLERGDTPGGRAGRLIIDGYQFDTGPTVLTMPELADECFDAVGLSRPDFVSFRRVDPMYLASFADGTVLHVRHGREAMAAEIDEVCGPREAAAFHRFCDWLTALHDVELPHFIDRNYDSVLDLARPLRAGVQLARLGGFRRLASKLEQFFGDERLHRVFGFQSMYAGLAPYEALALYGVITYMDTVAGVYVPEGGMHALPAALAAAAEKAGVTFHYRTGVERILLAHGSSGPVRGVRLDDGEILRVDAVVCNADLPVAYRTLLPGLAPPRVTRRGTYSPSCVVWHVGVRGELPVGAAHHNIHFGRQWAGAFRALLEDGTRMPDPSMLVTIPTRDDPAMAPPERHTLYVLEPVPNLDGRIDWLRERSRVRDGLYERLATLGYPTDVEVEALVDPLDWERQGLERGTPFALSHAFFQTGPFRPPNVDRRAPGLVFSGSGTVPGVGVPMVLLSGKLAARRVSALEASGRR
ncbi:phytoene desaturase family protein [Rhabdothermincola sediminis]|uniref:phytoene desaturase family protein n=1 Tax=Rhabdothermincola sediminis TaxID=2751370 RepID=UPI001AA029CB|nr:phytoene desaturase family protein [Rhabdothermincola sediminis]